MQTLEPTCFKATRSRRSNVLLPPPTNTETCFTPYGITLVHTSDVRKGHFCLFHLPKPSMIYNCLNASISTKLTLNGVHKGFINFGRKTRPDKAIEWEWVWCCLEGKVIKCFIYPDHEEECKPLVVLELDTCVSGVVRVERPKTLLLEIMENRGEGAASTKIFLSSYSMDEIKIWEKILSSVVNVLKSWDFSTKTWWQDDYYCCPLRYFLLYLTIKFIALYAHILIKIVFILPLPGSQCTNRKKYINSTVLKLNLN